MYRFKCFYFFRLTGWVLLKLFNSFFWNIQIHKGQLEMVKAATEVRVDFCALSLCFPWVCGMPLELFQSPFFAVRDLKRLPFCDNCSTISGEKQGLSKVYRILFISYLATTLNTKSCYVLYIANRGVGRGAPLAQVSMF